MRYDPMHLDAGASDRQVRHMCDYDDMENTETWNIYKPPYEYNPH